jgi:hypothetical protein
MSRPQSNDRPPPNLFGTDSLDTNLIIIDEDKVRVIHPPRALQRKLARERPELERKWKAFLEHWRNRAKKPDTDDKDS